MGHALALLKNIDNLHHRNRYRSPVSTVGTVPIGVKAVPPLKSMPYAGVVQWQNGSFPSCIRGFDSLHPLQTQEATSGGLLRLDCAVTANPEVR
jgi:hypothetical protein